jgi:integrase
MALGLAGWFAYHLDWEMANFLLIGFWGSLRTGELASTRWEHIMVSEDMVITTIGLLVTKGGQRRSAQ